MRGLRLGLCAAALAASSGSAASSRAGGERPELEGALSRAEYEGPAAALAVLAPFAPEPGLSEAQRGRLLLALGQSRLRLGDYAGAAREFKAALSSAPVRSRAAALLARALRARPEEALPHAEAASAGGTTPRERASASVLAGEILLDLGDENAARRRFERALSEAPDDLDALQALARLSRDRPGEASAFGERALRAADAAPAWCRGEAYRLSARLWLELGDWRSAAGSLARALAHNPADLDALESLLAIKRSQPEAAGAARAARARAAERPWTETAAAGALAADPGDLEALRGLIALRRGQGRRAEAEALAERFAVAARQAPAWQEAAAYRLAARIWSSLGRKDAASGAADRALDLDRRIAVLSSLDDARDLFHISKKARETALADIQSTRAELFGTASPPRPRALAREASNLVQ